MSDAPSEFTPVIRPGAAPETIDRFPVVRLLGRGGMGQVWLCRHPDLGIEVAVKSLAGGVVDAEQLERFLREAQNVARLEHPHVVRILEAGVDAHGRPFMVLEYLDGGNAADAMRHSGGRVLEPQALAIAIAVCRALCVAQRAGIVHRDIKPENILLANSGDIKLADLGLARSLEAPGNCQLTATGIVLGTPAYIAPEQALRSNHADIRSDIYGLGATLYHFVTGRPPYEGDSPLEVLMKHVQEPLPHPQALAPELSRGLSAVICKCLEKNPDCRYATAEELLSDLLHVQNGGSPSALHASPLPDSLIGPLLQGRRDDRRARRRLTVLSVLLGIALLSLLLAHPRRNELEQQQVSLPPLPPRPQPKATVVALPAPAVATTTATEEVGLPLVPEQRTRTPHIEALLAEGRWIAAAEEYLELSISLGDNPAAGEMMLRAADVLADGLRQALSSQAYFQAEQILQAHATFFPQAEALLNEAGRQMLQTHVLMQTADDYLERGWQLRAAALLQRVAKDPRSEQALRDRCGERLQRVLLDRLAIALEQPALEPATRTIDVCLALGLRGSENERFRTLLARYDEQRRAASRPAPGPLSGTINATTSLLATPKGYDTGIVRIGSDRQASQLIVYPGVLLRGGEIHVDHGTLELRGRSDSPVLIRDARILVAGGAKLTATGAVFERCQFYTRTAVGTSRPAHLTFTDCLLFRVSFAIPPAPVEALQLANCVLIQSSCPSRLSTPAAGDQWQQMSRCRFDECHLAPSFIWLTDSCDFHGCRIIGEEPFRSDTFRAVRLHVPETEQAFLGRIEQQTLAVSDGRLAVVGLQQRCTPPGILDRYHSLLTDTGEGTPLPKLPDRLSSCRQRFEDDLSDLLRTQAQRAADTGQRYLDELAALPTADPKTLSAYEAERQRFLRTRQLSGQVLSNLPEILQLQKRHIADVRARQSERDLVLVALSKDYFEALNQLQIESAATGDAAATTAVEALMDWEIWRRELATIPETLLDRGTPHRLTVLTRPDSFQPAPETRAILSKDWLPTGEFGFIRSGVVGEPCDVGLSQEVRMVDGEPQAYRLTLSVNGEVLRRDEVRCAALRQYRQPRWPAVIPLPVEPWMLPPGRKATVENTLFLVYCDWLNQVQSRRWLVRARVERNLDLERADYQPQLVPRDDWNIDRLIVEVYAANTGTAGRLTSEDERLLAYAWARLPPPRDERTPADVWLVSGPQHEIVVVGDAAHPRLNRQHPWRRPPQDIPCRRQIVAAANGEGHLSLRVAGGGQIYSFDLVERQLGGTVATAEDTSFLAAPGWMLLKPQRIGDHETYKLTLVQHRGWTIPFIFLP